MSAKNGHRSDDLERRYDALYEQFGRPLEREHRGQYLAVSQGGQTALGSTFLEVARKASDQFGPGSFVFKIGGRAVGQLHGEETPPLCQPAPPLSS